MTARVRDSIIVTANAVLNFNLNDDDGFPILAEVATTTKDIESPDKTITHCGSCRLQEISDDLLGHLTLVLGARTLNQA